MGTVSVSRGKPWGVACPPARREPRTQKLHAERGHPVSNGAVSGRKRQPVVVFGAIDHVEVPRGQYAVCAGGGASNERRQVRDYAVRRAVRVDPPRSVRGRVWTCPSSIHGHHDERWSVLRDNASGGDCPDAADRDLFFGRLTYRADLLEPLDLNAIRQLHNHRPPVVQTFEPAFVQREFQTCESQCSTGPVSTSPATSGGTGPASCSRAMSAPICNSWRHGSWLLAIFQLTTVVGIRPPEPSRSIRVLRGYLQSRRPDCLPAPVRTPQEPHRAPRYRRKRSVCPSLSESCRGAPTAEH